MTLGHNGAVVNRQAHWEGVYGQRDLAEVSWYEPLPATSLKLIEDCGLPRDAAILDVGAGASRLAGGLLNGGYTDVTVADFARAALDEAAAQVGSRSDEIDWAVADVREHDFGRDFDLWHDRALFHFMVEQSDRDGYLNVLLRTLRRGGHLIIATFGPDGPSQCSGLPVSRYRIEDLSAELGAGFQLVSSHIQVHRTPSDREQQFLWAHFCRGDA